MAGPGPDARLSKYRLIRPLGSGGMGDVYLARDTLLKRDVALKLIARDRIYDDRARRRLVREAQAAAALDHPCICAVYEVNADPEGPAFIARQSVEGDTLAKRLRRGPLDPERALRLFADLADALAAAHRHGVIHRDVKPENIVITPSGRPKLLDFGIAHVAPGVADQDETTHTHLTGDGVLLGTPAYMSPEQVEGRPIDARSDLFSLGCVLFECLTGRPAFVGRTRIEVCAAVLHVEPPAPSSIQPELTERYDRLCRRLVMKNPGERLQTAQELLGAIRMLLPDQSASDPMGARSSRRTFPLRRLVLASVVAAVTLSAGWLWQTERHLFEPAPSAEAVRWYERGTSAIRDGAYESARRALEQALAITPDFPQLYVRLAEAHSDLDEESEAKDALLSVDRARLPPSDRLRFDAITARTTGKLDVSVAKFQELAARDASDAAVWLDLGRAQELAGRPSDARVSYERAIQTDGQYAAGHLRLGLLEREQGQHERALEHLTHAERLYRAASHVEGETEALLGRGIVFAGVNEFAQAKSAVQRALVLASGLKSRSQEIRGQLVASSLTAAEGRLGDAEAQATAAVKLALDAGLDAVAANGLIDLASTLMQRRHGTEAARHLKQAIDLSERRRAHRTSLRARVTLASLSLDQGKPQEAIGLAEGTLDALRTRGYRRWELNALSIAARGYEYLGDYDRAAALSGEVLQMAETLNDDSQIADALENLAGQAMAQGLLPQALDKRRRQEEIHRRQQDMVNLAFDLQNHAEVLIRLGRGAEADALLDEIDERAAAGSEAFVGRRRRVTFLRALRATFDERFDDAARFATEVLHTSGSRWDGTAVTARALLDHAVASGAEVLGPAPKPSSRAGLTPRLAREVSYWELAALTTQHQSEQVVNGVLAQLNDESNAVSDEFRWRIAALGVIAARQRHDRPLGAKLAVEAATALNALKSTFHEYLSDYLNRPDLVRLRREAALHADF